MTLNDVILVVKLLCARVRELENALVAAHVAQEAAETTADQATHALVEQQKLAIEELATQANLAQVAEFSAACRFAKLQHECASERKTLQSSIDTLKNQIFELQAQLALKTRAKTSKNQTRDLLSHKH